MESANFFLEYNSPSSRLIVGLLADTHVPDRVRQLNPQILEVFAGQGVDLILHAGDVSVPGVIVELETVSPVIAVRGNRDWLALPDLPLVRELDLAGVRVSLTHGHGRWWNYLVERLDYMIRGYRIEVFRDRLQAEFPLSRVVIFGHTHRPLVQWVGEQLILNPGSCHCPDVKDIAPSIGILKIYPGGELQASLHWLE